MLFIEKDLDGFWRIVCPGCAIRHSKPLDVRFKTLYGARMSARRYGLRIWTERGLRAMWKAETAAIIAAGMRSKFLKH